MDPTMESSTQQNAQILPEKTIPSQPKSNGITKVLLVLLGIILLISVGSGGYYLGTKHSSSTLNNSTKISPTSAVLPTTIPTLSSASEATFVPKDTTGWKDYEDSSYSFLYPPTWTVTTFIDIYHNNREQITLKIPSHPDIQANFGPNPHGNPGGGGGPSANIHLQNISNTISFTFHGKKQVINEGFTVDDNQDVFGEVILDNIQLDEAKDLDASFITYHPTMSLAEYYDVRNTFLTVLQTLTIK